MAIETEQQSEAIDGLPDKFASVADMAASYAELEKKLGTDNQSASKSPSESSAADNQSVDSSEANVLDESRNDKDLEPFYAEYQVNGSLSEDSMVKLSDMGYTSNQIERIIRLETAEAEREAADLYATIDGGQESYMAATAWALNETDAAYQEEYNLAINAGGTLRGVMIKDLMNKWKDAGAVFPEGSNLQGQNIQNVPSHTGSQSDKYDSQAEWHAAMSSKDYKRNQKVRDEVNAKALRSFA